MVWSWYCLIVLTQYNPSLILIGNCQLQHVQRFLILKYWEFHSVHNSELLSAKIARLEFTHLSSSPISKSSTRCPTSAWVTWGACWSSWNQMIHLWFNCRLILFLQFPILQYSKDSSALQVGVHLLFRVQCGWRRTAWKNITILDCSKHVWFRDCFLQQSPDTLLLKKCILYLSLLNLLKSSCYLLWMILFFNMIS